MRNNIIFALFIVLVVSGLFMISGTRSPQIPNNAYHREAGTEQACLSCHGPGMERARKEGHPPKDQCFICHKRSRKAAGE